MDMFVGVVVFVVAVAAMALSYLYVLKCRRDEVEKKNAVDKAWKMEQNRQRRAAKAKKAAQGVSSPANSEWVKPEWTQQ